MKLIVKISINKYQNQNQMKETVETQTKYETDNKSDTEFVIITPSHPRDCLKRKVLKINYSWFIYFFRWLQQIIIEQYMVSRMGVFLHQ